MTRRHLLSENEIGTLKFLCYNFGTLFPVYFPKNISRNSFPCTSFYWWPWAVGLFSEKKGEYLHDLIKLEAAQLSYVRNDFERLRPIIEQDEQWAQVDPSLCTPSRGVKVVKTRFRPVIFLSYFFISVWCMEHWKGSIIYFCLCISLG